MPIENKSGNISANYNQAVNQKLEERRTRTLDDKKQLEKEDQSILSKFLNDDKESAKMGLVKSSLGLVSAQSQTKSNKLNESVKREIDSLFEQRESSSDEVSISSGLDKNADNIKETQKNYIQQKTQQANRENAEVTKRSTDFTEISKDNIAMQNVADQITDQQKKDLKLKQQEQQRFSAKQTKRDSSLIETDAPMFQAQDEVNKTMKKSANRDITEQGKTGYSTEEQEKNDTNILKNYASQYAEYLTSNSPQKKRQLEDIKEKLYAEGYSTKSLTDMDAKVGNMVRQQVAADLKNQIVKYLFSKSQGKIPELREKVGLSDLLDNISANSALGGEDFGNYLGGLGDMVKKISQDVDVSGFMLEEAEELFVRNRGAHDDPETFDKEFYKLSDLCLKVRGGVDMNSINLRLTRSIDNFGLFHFLPPEDPNRTFSFEEGDQRGKREAVKNYLFEEDKLEETLRNLYYLKALSINNFSLKKTLVLQMSIITIKNKMLKMGLIDKNLEEQIKKEGELLAIDKLLSNLHKAFLEQATLSKLTGPNYQVIKTRKNFLITTLHKIGYKIKKEECDRIRDNANREMFPVLKEQFKQLEMLESINRNISISRKKKNVAETMKRIKEESNIYDNLELDTEELNRFSEKSIQESA